MTRTRATRYGIFSVTPVRRAGSLLLGGSAALLLLLAAGACLGGGGGGSAGGGADDLMRMLSDDAAGILYLDIAEIDGDDDLSNFRRSVERNWVFDSYDLDLRDLDYVAFSEEDGGGDVYLLGGVDDRDLKDELDDQDYDDDEIADVEVWINLSQKWQAFAFLPGGAVLIADDREDDMEDMLRRRDRQGRSARDHEMGDVWRDLPSGYMRLATSARCAYDDCVAYGFSLKKENSRKVKIVMLFEFDSERDAERGGDDMEEDGVGDLDCDDVNVRQNGSRVRAEAVCDLDEFDSFSRFGFF